MNGVEGGIAKEPLKPVPFEYAGRKIFSAASLSEDCVACESFQEGFSLGFSHKLTSRLRLAFGKWIQQEKLPEKPF